MTRTKAAAARGDSSDRPAPQHTADGHYVVVDGRRWRASDPSIPESLRQELVDELMAARRAVRGKETDARARVQDAKVALGERGAPWWETPEPEELRERIRASLRSLLRKRAGSTICPSDVARIVGGPGETWRGAMDEVREVAAQMADAGDVVVTQKGRAVDARTARGPVRIGFPVD
ncbi:DUF3253 domain-containing protein [Brachybacterium endophyticum]|uniref:DUF3253 domain-containing protein n=1 Tax=Brachybacterium endophyticum TaxID=2182385 RepID=A0A2U2RJK5_9MICO|nr:DUF3253 domain-containing protein [Brachybacterium endophyticum]PWH06057.1 DUF3253 domain-containing protein [Brachybacterium endophyticum]